MRPIVTAEELQRRRLRAVALVREGDQIRLDLAAKTLDLLVDDAELERRRAEWEPREQNLNFGVAGKYAKLVGSAAQCAAGPPPRSTSAPAPPALVPGAGAAAGERRYRRRCS